MASFTANYSNNLANHKGMH